MPTITIRWRRSRPDFLHQAGMAAIFPDRG
jgi:hypothetical protein